MKIGILKADAVPPELAGDYGQYADMFQSIMDPVHPALAPGTAVLAGSDFCENAVCQLGDHVLTFQGHPEFSRDFTEGLLNIRREAVGEDNYVQAMSSLSQPVDRDRVARWIVGFLNQQGLSPSMATPPNHRGN